MANTPEIQALVDAIHDLDEQRANFIAQLTVLVQPTNDEVQNVYDYYRDCGKESAQELTELNLPLVVLEDREQDTDENTDTNTNTDTEESHG